MKINSESRGHAKALFRYCMETGQLDEERVRTVVRRMAEEKPRNFYPILQHFKRLIALELDRRTAVIESAAALSPVTESALTDQLRGRVGPQLTVRYETNPSLIGGLRIRVGSDVWDGSIANRLATLSNNL